MAVQKIVRRHQTITTDVQHNGNGINDNSSDEELLKDSMVISKKRGVSPQRLYEAGSSLWKDSVYSHPLQVALSLLGLTGPPLLLYSYIPGNDLSEFVNDLMVAWSALLRSEVKPIFVVCVFVSLYCGYVHDKAGNNRQSKKEANEIYTKACCIVIWFFLSCTVIHSQVQLMCPHPIWNPFLWFTFPIYLPSDALAAMDGVVCPDYNVHTDSDSTNPLCLPESSWQILSAGVLSSKNENDVASVLKGLDYAQHQSGGFLVNVLCRDCKHGLNDLRQNVENMKVFFPTLSVVVFENDSSDGSRDYFKQWAAEANGYNVDLVECEEAVDCRFGESHRYDSFEATDYSFSSAVGKMGKYRQRLMDYITDSPRYENYSHMLVADGDLGVSLSPLGILHTLGEVPDYPVASSGRQTWPGAFGTVTPPYDFSAFRAVPTEQNARLRKITDWYCGLLPAGHRWRNMCHITSPAHMILVRQLDTGKSDIYRVESAFNGATLYPLQLVRDNRPKYDQGDDGQRCEHIGFNLGLKSDMFVNRKWSFNIKSSAPGGPSGMRVMKNMNRVLAKPHCVLAIVLISVFTFLSFSFSTVRIGMLVLYPLLFKGFFTKTKKRSLPLHHKGGRSRVAHKV